MSHENNHELTRIALREEVERSLESVLPANLPDKKKREAATKVEQILERYSSPYPDPATLSRLEALAPGSAGQIIAATITDLEHRREMDKREVDVREREIGLVQSLAAGEVGSVRQGRWLGFFAYIACLLFSGTMFVLGSQTLALAGFGAAALGIIAQLIKGGSSGISISAEETPASPDEKDPKKKS